MSASATTADLLTRVERFFGEYIRALDDRRFDDWLGMFAEEALYSIIRDIELNSGGHLYLLRESRDKLKNRIEMGADLDTAMRVHLLSGVRIDRVEAGRVAASSNFAVFINGAVSYSGQYRMTLVPGDRLTVADCVAVVANERPSALLYLPI